MRNAHFIVSLLILSVLSLTPSLACANDLTDYLNRFGAKKQIVRPAQGALPFEYIVPAGPYDQLFDWDMYFMGVALSYDHVGKPVANSVKDFLSYVGQNANVSGYAPRELSITGPWALPEMCKPFLAQAAIRASQTTGDYHWLDEVPTTSNEHRSYYDKLKLMTKFWDANRRGLNGLYIWHDGLESGADNNPAVSTAPALTTEGVDLQVYLYREFLAVATLAEKLGHPEDQKLFQKKADDLRKLMIEKMWSAKDHFFYNLNSRTGAMIKIKSWVGFTPLWAKMLSPNMGKVLIEDHLLVKNEFWSNFGVRTLSKTEALFSTDDYWRGPIWILSNYLLMHGLYHYGYVTAAQELADKTVKLLVRDYQKSKGMNECYDSESGEPAAGGNFVSWNLLAEHIQEEAKTGSDPTEWR